MNPIFNNNGQVVAWQHNENIYHLDGSHAAVIDGDNVYGHSGQHLGVFDNGLFRDHQGGTVAFLDGASGGPMLPIINGCHSRHPLQGWHSGHGYRQ